MKRPLAGLRTIASRLAGDERGNIAILFGFFLAVGTAVSALAVDEGSLYLQRRQAQAAVDLASITAAADPANAFARARRVFAEAGLIDDTTSDAELAAGNGPLRLDVDTGSYAADPAIAAASRFAPGGPSPNAVRVRFRSEGLLYFAQSWAPVPEIGVAAVASTTPSVSFSVGSTLLQLSGGIPNAVLNALLGANVSLSAVSYNGLLNARVSIFGFLDSMAQELNISAGSYDEVLAASADQGTIARAIADNLTGADAAAAATLAQSLGHNGEVPLGKLLGLGDAGRLAIGTGASSGYTADVSALELLTASGAVSDGTHQLSLNLGAAVPGLSSLAMSLAVGEPQQFATWFALGPSGTIARTAQIRLRFVATIGGGPTLLNASIRVPLYLELAYAEAGVQSAACPTAGSSAGSAVIGAQPGIARLTLGDIGDPAFGDFSAGPGIGAATLVNVAGLLKVTGSGQASIGQLAPTPLSFSSDDIAAGAVQQATTTDFTQSLATSLLSSLDLRVSAFGLGLPGSPAIKSTVNALVAPLGPVLDSTIATTLNALGLSLGIADVRVYGVTCRHPVLVG